MRKIIFIMFFLTFLFSIGRAQKFCCRDLATGQAKCYATGECCNGYWYLSCYDFKIWLEPSRAYFVVGKKTPINLYIENTGVYTDNYKITYTISDPNLALVDITGISHVKNVEAGEIRRVQPRITVISAKSTGDVDFTVTADSGSSKTETLTILESGLPMSLPEFGFFGMTGMIILAGIIYFLIKRKH